MNKAEAAHAEVHAGGRAPLNYFNYFTELEDAFIRRRGRHLLLSPLDWALIESWKEMGVPLHVALRGIERAFDSHASRPRRRSVKSLMYCQEEVEAQFAEWLEGQRGANVKAGDRADDSGAAGRAEADAADEGEGLPFPRTVIAAHLAECREALASARESRRRKVGEDELCEALARAAARLEPYRARIERATYEQTLDNLLAKALREEYGVPRLSLFYL